ncbi:CBO0543 family protein [Priestia megaterium]|uniref:CBO0543 family protein n=1 Tax=Priestia megaterium TaxID=1404 RepID=UPI00386F7DBF
MLYTIGSCLRLTLPFIFLIGAWRFGDWRNWKNYYPTILFLIIVDFGISILLYEYPLWKFEKSLFFQNHTIIDFFIVLTEFCPMILIYLYRYPFQLRWFWQVGYIGIWSIFWIIVEGVFKFTNLISYHNNWNFFWSCLVWIFMFLGLLLHYIKPIWAWLLCFSCTAFLIIYFHIPVSQWK